MVRLVPLWLVPLVCLAGCAGGPAMDRAGGTGADPAALLEGRWDNAAQFAAADPALHRPPVAGTPYPWLDRQVARFVEVDAPGLAGPEGRVVYLEWRSKPDGAISRQRLWVFRPVDGRLVMHFYMLADAARFSGAGPGSALFRDLGPGDVTGYPETCALPVRMTRDGFEAAIPKGCVITARSGRSMELSARISLMDDILAYDEAGLLPDGTYAFRVPGVGAYRFERQ